MRVPMNMLFRPRGQASLLVLMLKLAQILGRLPVGNSLNHLGHVSWCWFCTEQESLVIPISYSHTVIISYFQL